MKWHQRFGLWLFRLGTGIMGLSGKVEVGYSDEPEKKPDDDTLRKLLELEKTAIQDIDNMDILQYRQKISEIEESLKIIRKSKDYHGRNKKVLFLVFFVGNIYNMPELIFSSAYSIFSSFSPGMVSFFVLCVILIFPAANQANKEHKFGKSIIHYEILLKTLKERLSILEIKSDREYFALRQLTEKYIPLETYQNTNIEHTKKIFTIGKWIIFIGISLIIFTILGSIIAFFVFDKEIQLVKIIVGLASGVLVDGVGAIFIAMYGKTMETANAYQEGLIRINKAYLGSVFASMIKGDGDLQNQTLSAMAKAMTEGKDIDSKKS